MKSAQCRGIRLASVTGSLPLRSATCGEGAGRTFSRMARGASHVEDEGRRQKQSGSAAGRGVQPPPPQPVGRSSQSASSPAPRCWRLGESQRGPSALPSANISRAAQSQILLRAKCTTNCPTSSKWACLKGLPCATYLQDRDIGQDPVDRGARLGQLWLQSRRHRLRLLLAQPQVVKHGGEAT